MPPCSLLELLLSLIALCGLELVSQKPYRLEQRADTSCPVQILMCRLVLEQECS